MVDELEPRVHCAFGYTGHGVGPSHMIGRSLASLALDRRDEASRLALHRAGRRSGSRPSRSASSAATIIRRAILRKETAEEHGERAGPLTRFVAGIPERIGIHIGR